MGPGHAEEMRISIEGTATPNRPPVRCGGGGTSWCCVSQPQSVPPTPPPTPPGFEQQRGDMQSIAKKHRRVPYVLAMALPAERANELHSARRRRDLDTDYCFGWDPAGPPARARLWGGGRGGPGFPQEGWGQNRSPIAQWVGPKALRDPQPLGSPG